MPQREGASNRLFGAVAGAEYDCAAERGRQGQRRPIGDRPAHRGPAVRFDLPGRELGDGWAMPDAERDFEKVRSSEE